MRWRIIRDMYHRRRSVGSRFEVRGSRFEVRGSRFEVRGSRFEGKVTGKQPLPSEFEPRTSNLLSIIETIPPERWLAVREGYSVFSTCDAKSSSSAPHPPSPDTPVRIASAPAP